jgi:hypothetical protein
MSVGGDGFGVSMGVGGEGIGCGVDTGVMGNLDDD